MNKDFSGYAYIQEQTSDPDDYDGKFGYKIHDKGNRFYLTFDGILQSFGVMNRNRRIYLEENIDEQINTSEYIQTMLRQNSWVGEIDHPAPEFNGAELTMLRIANPNLRMSSHFIRRPKIVNHKLEAHIQTDSSNENGMNMAIKIVDGKIIPAFSARVLGELTKQNGKPVVNVKKLITYDWVLFPSHSDALGKINQPITESVNEIEKFTHSKVVFLKELAKEAANNSKETELLCEAFDLTVNDIIGLTTDGSIVIQENKNIYVQPITQDRIHKKTISALKDWLGK